MLLADPPVSLTQYIVDCDMEDERLVYIDEDLMEKVGAFRPPSSLFTLIPSLPSDLLQHSEQRVQVLSFRIGDSTRSLRARPSCVQRRRCASGPVPSASMDMALC